MAAARPQVTVHGSATQLELPSVFTSPIRPDIIQFVHTNMRKNARQAYAVSDQAGHQHSAESWGTGRAVSRIPRVSGGGTSRAGQAAFGNMCRKGRMFAPTRTWRKWHRKINTNQKRYAVASALAASALPSLVMARGHRISAVHEVPCVVGSEIESLQKTKQAIAALAAAGASEDVDKVRASRKLRTGKGKMRNRRHVQRLGPLVVYNEDQGIVRAFRNLPGVDLAQVERLNLLQLAPGGHMGRFIIWTKSAFERLNEIYSHKNGYELPRSIVTNADLTRVINSDEIQSSVRPALPRAVRVKHHKNPLKNLGVLVRLNPHALSVRRAELLHQQRLKAGKGPKKAATTHAASKKKRNHKRLAHDETEQVPAAAPTETSEQKAQKAGPKKAEAPKAAAAAAPAKPAEKPAEPKETAAAAAPPAKKKASDY